MKRRLKRKSHKKIIFIVLGGIIAAGTVIFLNLNYLSEIKGDYRDKLNAITMEYKSKEVRVYEAKADIQAGTILTLDNVYETTVILAQNSNHYMTSENIGNITLVDVKAGTWILTDMLRKDAISDYVREVEYSTFFIGNHIGENDYFDLHIQYPNGEDYIVLSKTLARRIDTANQYLYLWLSPEELFHISGAIVDCYLNEGTRLYSVKYIEPDIQKASYITYIPGTAIIHLIKNDPNIVNVAINALNEQVRLELEERLHLFYNNHETNGTNEGSVYYPAEGINNIGEERGQDKGMDLEGINENEEVYYVD